MRLLCVDASEKLDVPTPEVDELGRRIDFRLMRRFRLPQHRRGIQQRSTWSGKEFRRTQEDRGTFLPGRARPLRPCTLRGEDRRVRLDLAAEVSIGKDEVVVMRRNRRLRPSCPYVPAINDAGQIGPRRGQLCECLFELRSLRGAAAVALDWLVGDCRRSVVARDGAGARNVHVMIRWHVKKQIETGRGNLPRWCSADSSGCSRLQSCAEPSHRVRPR